MQLPRTALRAFSQLVRFASRSGHLVLFLPKISSRSSPIQFHFCGFPTKPGSRNLPRNKQSSYTESIYRLNMFPSQPLRIQASRQFYQATQKNNTPRIGVLSRSMAAIKKCPPELIPLGGIIGAALVFAGYSCINKLTSDKTLRLSRNKPEDRVM